QVPAVCAHTLVERRAALHPGSPAVLHAGETVSYAELDRRATALAHRLRALGVGPESLVGLAVERSPAMLAAMLAVWKSGAAYLPLDLAQPRERLAMILEDAPPMVVVTEEALLGSLPPHGACLLVLDREEGPVSSEPLPAAVPDNLAYVLFTSGSTGRPKGVQISHRALVNFLASMAEEPGLRETEVLLAVTTLSFDIAALELILPLTVGGRVAIAGREEAADGARLLERLSGASVLQATPATWRMLLDAGWTGSPDLRAFCGGEALPAALAARLLPRVAELWNLYGPTETTVWSAVRRVGPGEDEPASVAIGRPVANTRLHLLGRDGSPVPLEAAGELWIGGAGLARGYRGLPALTADRFRPDPFGEPGARLYRTGDLARRLPDGRIEFLGRLDHQVKIRGFRIELGEIEAALARHPAVAQAAVLARPDGGSDPRLVGYLVPRPGEAPKPEELRAFLRGRLPEPMLPTAFVTLEVFPLTPSGKLDRKALPAPEAAAAPGRSTAPGNPLEEMVANAWEEVLELE
ncbi:MAG: amino acid adenylation domain-containing protein, partial [Thermoanaerobaculia bacterium]